MVWHTPLLVCGKITWYDYIFYSLALQVVLTWLTNRTKRSILIPMIAHLFSNVLFATMGPLFSGSDQGQYWMLLVIAASAIATRGELGAETSRRSAPALTPEM
jgi:membrane protease YdiL (CAAX protease family)